jgi:hypothetical protein
MLPNIPILILLQVPIGTPMIAPLIKWDHSVDWPVVNIKAVGSKSECVCNWAQ